MIGQCLLNKNENATVPKSNFFLLNKALVLIATANEHAKILFNSICIGFSLTYACIDSSSRLIWFGSTLFEESLFWATGEPLLQSLKIIQTTSS